MFTASKQIREVIERTHKQTGMGDKDGVAHYRRHGQGAGYLDFITDVTREPGDGFIKSTLFGCDMVCRG